MGVSYCYEKGMSIEYKKTLALSISPSKLTKLNK
jgi:hypothetical protein